jgi:hypothetical protein
MASVGQIHNIQKFRHEGDQSQIAFYVFSFQERKSSLQMLLRRSKTNCLQMKKRKHKPIKKIMNQG